MTRQRGKLKNPRTEWKNPWRCVHFLDIIQPFADICVLFHQHSREFVIKSVNLQVNRFVFNFDCISINFQSVESQTEHGIYIYIMHFLFAFRIIMCWTINLVMCSSHQTHVWKTKMYRIYFWRWKRKLKWYSDLNAAHVSHFSSRSIH